MTKFNPKGKLVLTYGECLHPAMSITDEADARQYFAEYVAHIKKALVSKPRGDGMTAEQIARSNLGYFAGYYDNETRARVERLFSCAHPIFGGIRQNGSPTAGEALAAGIARAND
jgi:hypothetical protein